MGQLNRVLTTAVAATVAAVVVGAVPAGAAQSSSGANGVGSSTTKTDVLSVSLGSAGSLLQVGILSDRGEASIDPHTGAVGASNTLVPLTVDSKTANIHVAVPGLSTRAPGGASDAGGTALTLEKLGVPRSVATAEINPAALHSDYAPTAARSNMGAAQIRNLTVAGGAVASIDLLSSSLTADALSSKADNVRGVQVGTIKLLNLGGLMSGLGTSVTALPLSTVTNLVDSLGLPVGLPAGTTLTGTVNTLQSSITGLQTALATNGSGSSLNSNLTPSVVSTLQGLPTGGLGLAKTAALLPIPTQGTPVAAVNALVTQLTSQLSGLLGLAIPALDSFPLVQLSATSVGITTTAADTLQSSSAGVSVVPVKLVAAGIPLNLDLAGTVNTVNSTIGAANTALNGLLTKIGLPANLVSLDLLQQAHSVTQNGAYTLASAGVNVADLKIAAIDPAAVVSGVAALGGTPVSSVLTQLNAVVPAQVSSTAMSALKTALGVIAPLAGGAEVRVASLSGASTYTVAPTAVPTGSPISPAHTNLPRTGGNPALALVGVILALLSFGGIRMVRSHRALSQG